MSSSAALCVLVAALAVTAAHASCASDVLQLSSLVDSNEDRLLIQCGIPDGCAIDSVSFVPRTVDGRVKLAVSYPGEEYQAAFIGDEIGDLTDFTTVESVDRDAGTVTLSMARESGLPALADETIAELAEQNVLVDVRLKEVRDYDFTVDVFVTDDMALGTMRVAFSPDGTQALFRVNTTTGEPVQVAAAVGDSVDTTITPLVHRTSSGSATVFFPRVKAEPAAAAATAPAATTSADSTDVVDTEELVAEEVASDKSETSSGGLTAATPVRVDMEQTTPAAYVLRIYTLPTVFSLADMTYEYSGQALALSVPDAQGGLNTFNMEVPEDTDVSKMAVLQRESASAGTLTLFRTQPRVDAPAAAPATEAPVTETPAMNAAKEEASVPKVVIPTYVGRDEAGVHLEYDDASLGEQTRAIVKNDMLFVTEHLGSIKLELQDLRKLVEGAVSSHEDAGNGMVRVYVQLEPPSSA